MKKLVKVFVSLFAFLIISFGLAGFQFDFNADDDASISVSYDIVSSLMVFADETEDSPDVPITHDDLGEGHHKEEGVHGPGHEDSPGKGHDETGEGQHGKGLGFGHHHDDDEPPEVFEISTPTMFIGGFLLLLAVILVVAFLRRRKV
ncbi:MAG: hypothetical protein HYW47_07320 [Deltaproteobacteria bacterium]|nr:hypothetical protein [Deltaproteobacteria bacterium]